MTLHEKYLPDFDFNEVHRIEVRADRRHISDALTELDFRKSWMIRLLFSLRGINTGEVQGYRKLEKMGFTILEVVPDDECIFGLVGQFWKPSGNIRIIEADAFTSFVDDGFLKATWNFRIENRSDGKTILETETRIKCMGSSARRKFALYWFFIKPFSGLIRLQMLKSVKRSAERRHVRT